MPIFSGNRTGNGGYRVAANESYGDHDFGKVLYECAINDKRVFDSVMVREFKEIDARRNGTMLESEMRSFREFSVKEAWNSLKEKMKKLWEKIKGIFKKVTAKLAYFFVRSGKAYAKLNRKLIGAKVDDCEIPKYRKHSSKWDVVTTSAVDKGIGKEFNMQSFVGRYNKDTDAEQKAILSSYYNGVSSEIDPDNVRETFFNVVFEKEVNDVKFKALGVSVAALLETVSNGKKPIADLKKASKSADKALKKIMKELDKAAKKADSAKEGEEDHGNGDMYRGASKHCSAAQTFVSTMCSAQIAAIKFDIKQSRAVISKLAAYTPDNESAIYEMSCWYEAAEEDLDAGDPEEASSEDQVEIEVLVKGADADDVDVNIEDEED